MDQIESVNEEQVVTSEMPDFSNMPDEEFAALEPSFLDQDFGDGTQEGAIAGSEQETGDEEDSEATDSLASDDGLDDDDEDAGEGALSDSAGESAASEEEGNGQEAEGEEGAPEESGEEVDYKAAYEKLLAPFKANGKELRVGSVDEAVQLMQMGANYNKKMASLKPHLKMLKLMEKNGLLNEEKINFLIDVEKKNPEAVKKLVQDSGIDPLEINLEEVSEYKPELRTVDDRELELDAVLDEIKDTPTYRDTLNVVTSKWDGPSKQIVAQEPQLLKVINDHMASGVYQVISEKVESERMFGRLNGLSDLEAYRQVGDALHAQGGFDHLFQHQEQNQVPPKREPTPTKKVDDGQRNGKKRAASSTRQAPQSTAQPDYNPLALSDEEFERLVNERLM